MTVRECYESVGSDYEKTVGRLGSEALVKRFALKFLADPSFQELKEAVVSSDGETAFRMAHTLKGVCLNLGFAGLGAASSALTEALREKRDIDCCRELLEEVETEYEKLISALKKID